MADDKLIRANNPLVKDLKTSLRAGSLADLVRVKQLENVFLLLDCSGSMSSGMPSGKRRIDGLRETVKSILTERSLRMVQFGCGYEPSFIEQIPDPEGGTPLDKAIIFAKTNNAGRAIVISDGQPDDQGRALEAARQFGGRIDVVFVGYPGEAGEFFLKRLAESTGGESFTGDLSVPKALAGQVMLLLGDGDDDEDDDDA